MRSIQWLAFVALFGCSEPGRGEAEKPVLGAAAARGSCEGEGAGAVSDSGVSQVIVGRSIDEVRTKCRVVADSVEHDAEAMQQQVVYVAFGTDTTRVLIDDRNVFRLEVMSPNLRTAAGIGVGSRIAELAGGRVLEGDGRLYAKTPKHCGLSFRLSHIPTAQQLAAGVPSMAALPDSVLIDQILVTGCLPDDAAPPSEPRVGHVRLHSSMGRSSGPETRTRA